MKKSAPSHDLIRVLVADDHGVVREGLVTMIKQQPDLKVVGDTGRADEVVRLWQETKPDVTLLDLQFGSASGIDLIAELRALDASARVLVLTTYDLEEDIYRSLKAGARGYLLKDISRIEMIEAIRRVGRGEKILSSHIAAKLAERLAVESLTERETSVLELVAEGLANKDISFRLGIADTTVKAHLKGIFAKLGVSSRTEAVHVARQRGWIRR